LRWHVVVCRRFHELKSRRFGSHICNRICDLPTPCRVVGQSRHGLGPRSLSNLCDALPPSGHQPKNVFNKMQKEDNSDEMRFRDDIQVCKKIPPGTSWQFQKMRLQRFGGRFAATKTGILAGYEQINQYRIRTAVDKDRHSSNHNPELHTVSCHVRAASPPCASILLALVPSVYERANRGNRSTSCRSRKQFLERAI